MMNEVDDPGHEPTDNPQRWSAKWFRETDDSPSSSRPSVPDPRDVTPAVPASPGGSSARDPRDVTPAVPASPGGSSARPDMPVRVRIVWDAAVLPPVARGLMQAERDWFLSLVSPGSGARKVLDVQDASFTLSGGDGFVVDNPALPQTAVGNFADATNVLVGRAPNRATRLEPARPAPSTLKPARPADPPVRVRLVWDAGIAPPVARGLMQAERDWFLSLVGPNPGAHRVGDVQYMDFTLSAGGGFVVYGPGLPRIAVGKTADAINVLLVPDPPFPFSFSPVEEIRPTRRLEPDSPVRNPGSGFSPSG
jgi:hypothetical protein